MENLKELVSLLTLEKIKENRYRGQSQYTPWGRVFGGQVLGQALAAAYETVPEGRFAHSMHGYFILAGDVNQPIEYEVDVIRDGGSFTTRRVVAYQNDKPIFTMGASFQKKQEGFDHQISAPNVLPPDALLPDWKQIESLKETNPALHLRLTIMNPTAIEFRPVENFYVGKPRNRRPYRNVWFKSKDTMELDLPMQHQLLAYSSDYNLLTTAVVPHLEEAIDMNYFLASLDHAIWFHRDFKIDDWLLYSTDSPSAGGSRGFSRGNIFNEDGVLIASVVQEGLIRKFK